MSKIGIFITENSSLHLWRMDELKDVSIHHTALKILSEIKAMKNYDEIIYITVQVNPEFSSEDTICFKLF